MIAFLILVLQLVSAEPTPTVSSKAYTSDIRYDDGINFDTFAKKIAEARVNTLEDALSLVPTDFFNNYVLMYRSRSLQDASPLSPRAIVFGRSARFIFAFNGNQKQKGYNTLEMIQFREKTQRWEFREIIFNDNKPPVFSEANPQKCLECHQSPHRENVDMRPNWEPYNFWPGAYASVDDTIKPVLKQEYEHDQKEHLALYGTLARFLPQDFILVDEQAQELDRINRFFSSVKPYNKRYQFLPETYNTRAPLNLTKSLVSLNMYRVARLAKEELGGLFNTYKYSLLGLGHYAGIASSEGLKFSCGDLYMPKFVKELHLDRTLRERSLPTKQYIRSEIAGWHFGIAAGLDILFLPLGVQTDDWSMDFKTQGRFSFEDRFTSPHYSPIHLREAMNVVYAGDPALDMDCKQLQEQSEKALTQFAMSGSLLRVLKAHPIEVKKPTKPLIQRCISCHVNYEDGGQAPSIPFDDFGRLKPMLMKTGYPRGTLFEEIVYRTGDHASLKDQMPPAGVVERERRDEFIDRLKSLFINADYQ